MALGVINDLLSSPSLSPSVSMNVYLARQSRPGKSFLLRDDQPGCRQDWIPSVFPLPGQPFSWEKGFGEQQLKRQYLSSLLKKNTFTNENALKCHAGSCKLKSGSPRKSEKTTTEPDPVVLYQDKDREKVLGTSGPFTLQVKIIFSLDSFLK